MGLDIPEGSELIQEPITGVRQSRRIAQLKIKEEAERRKIEETVLNEITAEHKKKKSKKYEDKVFFCVPVKNKYEFSFCRIIKLIRKGKEMKSQMKTLQSMQISMIKRRRGRGSIKIFVNSSTVVTRGWKEAIQVVQMKLKKKKRRI